LFNRIFWPFDADQPAAAAHVSTNLGAGIELIQVRTGKNGLKPLRRTGEAPKGTREAVREEFEQAIRDIRGDKGEQLRKNAFKFKTEFAQAWEEKGSARLELLKFFEKYLKV
jgi:hypothetical protein